MMSGYLLFKLLHILSAMLLFGVGVGTAFHMWMAHLGGDVRAIAAAARSTVLADFIFTTPAVILQPLTGVAMVWTLQLDLWAPWLLAAYALYVLVGLCWLPVVVLQIRVRDLAAAALQSGEPLPPAYHRCMRAWFLLGWPAFAAMIAIFALMVFKPRFGY